MLHLPYLSFSRIPLSLPLSRHWSPVASESRKNEFSFAAIFFFFPFATDPSSSRSLLIEQRRQIGRSSDNECSLATFPPSLSSGVPPLFCSVLGRRKPQRRKKSNEADPQVLDGREFFFFLSFFLDFLHPAGPVAPKWKQEQDQLGLHLLSSSLSELFSFIRRAPGDGKGGRVDAASGLSLFFLLLPPPAPPFPSFFVLPKAATAGQSDLLDGFYPIFSDRGRKEEDPSPVPLPPFDPLFTSVPDTLRRRS